MNSPKELKRDLRRAALARRDALDPAWRIEAALGMAETAKERIAIEPGSGCAPKVPRAWCGSSGSSTAGTLAK